MSGMLRTVKPPWRAAIFVCTKCLKRQDRRAFRGDLKRALKEHGCKDLRVVACACLDVCPARAVTLAISGDFSTDRPRLRIVDRKQDCDALARCLIAEIGEPSLSDR